MAKCDLLIELDEPNRVYLGGEKIGGVVRVRVGDKVQCNGLTVRTVWKTHGRGNVDSGTTESEVVFSGEWQANQDLEYRFELTVGDWPPTYQGHYLNIDHYVEAVADIPWAFDPQVSQVFLMRPAGGRDAVATKSVAVKGGIVGNIIGGVVIVFVLFFCLMSAINPFMWVIGSIIALVSFAIWLLRVFLPKYFLGEVDGSLERDSYSPGENVVGKLSIRPRRNVMINGIRLRFEAREQVVSGSGTNRTTHRHIFFEHEQSLQQATMLKAEQLHEFPFSIQLPADAVYTVDLSDNDLIWSASLVVDIPRWPNWRKELLLAVVPGGETITIGATGAMTVESIPVTSAAGAIPSDEAPVTFAETALHLWSMRDNNEATQMLAEAVTGLSFTIEANVERRLLYSGENDPHVYPDGYAVWATYTDPPLPLVLYVPHELGDEFEQLGRGKWTGQGTIVGWDHVHRRLQIRIDKDY